jgi:hypothetical protein
VTKLARLGISLGVGALAGLAAFLVGSCLPARAVAQDFVRAVRDGRMQDAYALCRPELRFEGEPLDTLDRMRASPDLRYGGIVQLGFSGAFDWYTCFEAELSADERAWLILVRDGSKWQLADLRATEPEKCKGSE